MTAPGSVIVVGAGSVGRALIARWLEAGRDVTVAVRDASDAKYDDLRESASMVSLDQLPDSEITVLAMPGATLAELLDDHASRLDGRVIVDATNRVGGTTMHQLPLLTSALPAARVYRGFNTTGWENFAATVAGQRPDMLYCGPDGPERATVAALIADAGPRPVWLGDGTAAADVLDGVARLWFTLAFDRGLGRHVAFRILCDADPSQLEV
jgi:predicted dinucleotide-binding enzyme